MAAATRYESGRGGEYVEKVVHLNRVAKAKGATEGMAILLAVSVYLDIINLFLALLRLFGFAAGGSSRDD